MINIEKFWEAVLTQDAVKLKGYFKKDAYINWHCTNEHFTVDEYIKANCEYPGKWTGKSERIEGINNLIITVMKVYSTDKHISFHVVSFFRVEEEQIVALEEYWGDDGIAPQWRLDKKIGEQIN